MHWKLNEDWFKLLKHEIVKPYFRWLYKYLTVKYIAGYNIWPKEDNIFNALNLTSYKDTKVVIMGQDPYHTPDTAHGLAFSSLQNKIPPSLNNIFKEIKDNFGPNLTTDMYTGPNLTRWAKQGVLLLNTVLTVDEGKPNSHKKLGWNRFTTEIIKLINNKDMPVVFILWGNNAKELKKFITNDIHLILESVHPSPLSASKGFFGCNHFYKTNEFLNSKNIKEIEWI